MTIGAGIGLFVVGAILAFALTDTQIGALEVQTLGYILMLAGVLVAVLSFAMARRGGSRETVVEKGPRDERVTERRTEHRTEGDGPAV